MSLQEQMEKYKKDFEAKAPAEALAVMHRATRELSESGILNRTVKAQDMAPDFVLKNKSGQDVSLGDVIASGPLVLSVYRGRW